MTALDEIVGLVDEAIQNLTQNNLPLSLALLGEIKGYLSASMNVDAAWVVIREDYERGVAPRIIASNWRVYGITAKTISNRAHYERWGNPGKVKKGLKPSKHNKNTFYPNCIKCENPFEAYSGNAQICPTCKAYERTKV